VRLHHATPVPAMANAHCPRDNKKRELINLP
jgi:hypothetical protein